MEKNETSTKRNRALRLTIRIHNDLMMPKRNEQGNDEETLASCGDRLTNFQLIRLYIHEKLDT
ncbi:CLUMA_CG012330, isoform A [Clunio marinus]|uniref:CLUMA_CG012330, isoform A n=1 Tax=Clunio marinus TaxID=568069 RepID=A0A1J1IF16_9DIPT|nr:CLUMA_CG012330, isoform A [Clunio marinus]